VPALRGQNKSKKGLVTPSTLWYNTHMKDRNNNRAEVRLDPASTPKKPRFDVQVFGGDSDNLIAEDNFLGWGGLRLRNMLLFSGVNHVRYMDEATREAAGLQ
jgi:hypothetical protein